MLLIKTIKNGETFLSDLKLIILHKEFLICTEVWFANVLFRNMITTPLVSGVPVQIKKHCFWQCMVVRCPIHMKLYLILLWGKF
jgi:hypothetical protein